MTDIKRAISNLDGNTISLCKGKSVIVSGKRGISPMIDFISEGIDLNGYSVADKVVGKAVAMLFIKAGIKEVYAETLSVSAKIVLEKYSVPFTYGILTEKIINREGTDICPMEKVVLTVEDIETGYSLLCEKLKSIRTFNAKK